LDKENVVEIALIAETYSQRCLLNACINIIASNLVKSSNYDISNFSDSTKQLIKTKTLELKVIKLKPCLLYTNSAKENTV